MISACKQTYVRTPYTQEQLMINMNRHVTDTFLKHKNKNPSLHPMCYIIMQNICTDKEKFTFIY